MVRLEFSIALRYQVNGPGDFIFNLHAAKPVPSESSAARGIEPAGCADDLRGAASAIG
jgi:hypothetical protein